jgi:hypothetical protein
MQADGEVEKYDGEIKAPALREFLLAFSSDSIDADAAAEGAGGSSGSGAGNAGGKGAAWAFVKLVGGGWRGWPRLCGAG